MTKTVLRRLDDVVNVGCVFQRMFPPQFKKLQSDIKDILSEYKAFGGKHLHITYEDPSSNDTLKRSVTESGVLEFEMDAYEKDKAQALRGS